MSTISAELNSLATATVIDFYRRRIRTEETDEHYLKIGKLATGFWGIFACVVAYNASQLGSLIEVVNKFGSFFYGSLLGVFVLAMGTKRANGSGAFWGLLAGMTAVAAVSYFSDLAALWQSITGSTALVDMQETFRFSFLWYNVIGCVVVVVVGLIVSAVTRGRGEAVPVMQEK
jgi:Na+/proline symporter